MNHVAHQLGSADISVFSSVINKFCYIKKNIIAFWYIVSNSFNFFESLKIVLIKMVMILMMSVKLATLGYLKMRVFWSEGYDVIISVNDVTNKILSRDSNYIVDMFMWLKFGNFSISMREVIITSIS